MRGGSFDSPSADRPSAHQLPAVPADHQLEPVRSRSSLGDAGCAAAAWTGEEPADALRCVETADAAALSWEQEETDDALRCRSSASSPLRTRSVASLRRRPPADATDDPPTERCAAVASTPNIRWTCAAAAAAAQCVRGDSAGARTSDRTGSRADMDSSGTSRADPDSARTAAAASRRHIVQPTVQRLSRSSPDVLKLPPSNSSSSCLERHRYSTASLDRSRPL